MSPGQASGVPRGITRSPKTLAVVWEDGHESVYPFRGLRLACPCAVCVDEWTGRSLLDLAAVPEGLGAEKAELVGNYAVALQFTDGHSTGIYSFEKLRAMCPCPACKPAQGAGTA